MGGLQASQFQGGYDATDAVNAIKKEDFFKEVKSIGSGKNRPIGNKKPVMMFDERAYNKARSDASTAGYNDYFNSLTKEQLHEEMKTIEEGDGYFATSGGRKPGRTSPDIGKESRSKAMERYTTRYKELNQMGINEANERTAAAKSKVESYKLMRDYEQQEKQRLSAAKRGSGQTKKGSITKGQYDEAKSLLGTDEDKTTTTSKIKQKGRDNLLFKGVK